jgi:hypothetical protein
VEVERFAWTQHEEMRLRQRRLDASDIERANKNRHSDREVNDGQAEWLVDGETADGTAFEAIYNHPHGGDEAAVRIVSVWRLNS